MTNKIDLKYLYKTWFNIFTDSSLGWGCSSLFWIQIFSPTTVYFTFECFVSDFFLCFVSILMRILYMYKKNNIKSFQKNINKLYLNVLVKSMNWFSFLFFLFFRCLFIPSFLSYFLSTPSYSLSFSLSHLLFIVLICCFLLIDFEDVN